MTALLLTTSAVALPSDVEALTKANGGQAPAVATRSTALSPSDFAASSSSDSSSSFFSLVRSLPASASLGHASAEAAGVLRVAAAALAPGGTLELAEEVRKEWESKWKMMKQTKEERKKKTALLFQPRPSLCSLTTTTTTPLAIPPPKPT